MKVVHTDGVYVCLCTFEERRHPKDAGFQFDSGQKRWWTRDARVAARLRPFFGDSAKRQILRDLIAIRPWTLSLPVPPKGLRFHDFQTEAAYFALARSRSYLALDPGLGKTIVAAMVARAFSGVVVYICPPFLARTVEEEFKRWYPSARTLRLPVLRPRGNRKSHHQLGPRRDVRDNSERTSLDTADVLIVPDTLIASDDVRRALQDFARCARALGLLPLLVVDEAHRFKTPTAQRTRALLGGDREGLFRAFIRQVYLSGTPLLNRPFELFPLLSKVAPETIAFRSEEDYGRRYCNGKLKRETCRVCKGKRTVRGKRCPYCKGYGAFDNGWDFTGASNLPELKENLKPFMLRIRKRDVLKDLPPKTEEVIILGDGPMKLVPMEKALSQLPIEDIIEKRLGFEDRGNVGTYRRRLGLLKLKDSVDFLHDLLEEGDEHVLVFAYHKAVIAGLVKGLQGFKPVVITGATDMADRHERVRRFQQGGTRLFIGNYVACGVGLTLTKATRVVFVEYSWVDKENEQAADRAHRIGQRDHVFVQYLTYAGSLDRKVIEVNLRKRKITEQI